MKKVAYFQDNQTPQQRYELADSLLIYIEDQFTKARMSDNRRKVFIDTIRGLREKGFDIDIDLRCSITLLRQAIEKIENMSLKIRREALAGLAASEKATKTEEPKQMNQVKKLEDLKAEYPVPMDILMQLLGDNRITDGQRVIKYPEKWVFVNSITYKLSSINAYSLAIFFADDADGEFATLAWDDEDGDTTRLSMFLNRDDNELILTRYLTMYGCV